MFYHVSPLQYWIITLQNWVITVLLPHVLFPHSDHVTHDITPKPHNPSQHQQWIEAMCFFTRVTCGRCRKAMDVERSKMCHNVASIIVWLACQLHSTSNWHLRRGTWQHDLWNSIVGCLKDGRWQLFLTCRSRIPREESSSLAHAI